MSDYAVFLHLDLLEVVPKRGSQRLQVMSFIRSLAAQPSTEGDYTEKDPTLRIRQVKVVNDYAITYWVDHPAKAVMVADIRRADK